MTNDLRYGSIPQGTQIDMQSQAHIGYIQTGSMAVQSVDGSRVELGPGEAFEVGPGHNAWVVGDEMCVALDVAVKPVPDIYW